jgi:nucleoside-diphosphate-sugar epimerase
MREILVTGGNGFVGRHLVSALQDRGDRVRVLVLPAEDPGWLEQRGVAAYRGDICKPETLGDAVRGVDGIVHLAAMMDVWRPIEDYRAVNVTGAENVCRAALAAGVQRLVHVSSSSVYGVDLRGPADESFPLAPFPDPYPITKAAGDLVVQRMIREHALPAVIVRPDQIFGPGDHLHFAAIADRLRTGLGILVGSGDNAIPLVFVTDAVRGLLLALDNKDAAGRAYNITNDEPLTQRQLMDAIAAEIGVRPPRVHVPYRVLRIAGYVAERLTTLTGTSRRPPITRLGVAFLGTDNRYAIDKARRELGYHPRVPLRCGVRIAAAWYLQEHSDTPSPVAAAEHAAEGART